MQDNGPYLYPRGSINPRFVESSNTPLSAVNYAAYKPSSPSFPGSNQSHVYHYNPNPILIDQKQITIKPRVNQPIPQQRPQTIIHEIVQPKIIEETVVHHERNDREGQKAFYKDNPDVNTVDDNKWMAHYDRKKQRPVPPQRPSSERQKSCCKTAILVLLGLLALGGLITAIVLGAKKLTQQKIFSQPEHSNGIPQTSQYPQFSITQETIIIKNYNKNHPMNQSVKQSNSEFKGIAPIPVIPIPDDSLQYSVPPIPIPMKPTQTAKQISNIQSEKIQVNSTSSKKIEELGQNYSIDPITVVPEPEPLDDTLKSQAQPSPTVEPILLIPAKEPSLSQQEKKEPQKLIYSYDPFKTFEQKQSEQLTPQQISFPPQQSNISQSKPATTVITSVQPIFAEPIAAHLREISQ